MPIEGAPNTNTAHNGSNSLRWLRQTTGAWGLADDLEFFFLENLLSADELVLR